MSNLPWLGAAVVLAAGLVLPATCADAGVPDAERIERGAYLFRAADCGACHTDAENGGQPLSGGRALDTPFGRFYGTNITPDPETGIGRWSEADFVRALREGVAPDGRAYYPVFPYPAFTHMTDDDLRDLAAYVFAQPPVARPNRPHEVRWVYRLGLGAWRRLYFRPGPMRPQATRSAPWNRGAYLVEAVSHCGECHTPRTWLGGPEPSLAMAGTSAGPDGKRVPNITPDPDTGIGGWDEGDLRFFLQTGTPPDGDPVGGVMAEVVTSLRGLRDADLEAMIVYLRALPPLRHAAGRNPDRKDADTDEER